MKPGKMGRPQVLDFLLYVRPSKLLNYARLCRFGFKRTENNEKIRREKTEKSCNFVGPEKWGPCYVDLCV